MIEVYNEVKRERMVRRVKELLGWVCVLGSVFVVMVVR